MRYLNDYMTEDERICESVIAVVDNKLAHLMVEFEKVNLDHKLNILSIENKVLMESGSEDDLGMLYFAEAEEVKQKKKGIISSIIGTILKFFKRIKDAIFGAKDEIKEENIPEKGIKVNEDPIAIERDTRTCISKVRGSFSRSKGKFVKAAAAVGTAAAAVGGFFLVKKKVVPVMKSLSKLSDESSAALKEAQAKVDAMDPNSEGYQEAVDACKDLKSCGNRIFRLIEDIKKIGTPEYNKARAEVDEEERDKKEENKRAKERDKANKKAENDEERFNNNNKYDDETISNANKTIADINNRIRELSEDNQNIIEEISRAKNILRKVESISDGGFFDKRKYDKLRNKPTSQLTDRELRQLDQLDEKLGSKMSDKSHRVKQIENLISELVTAKRSNHEEINRLTRNKIATNAHKRGTENAKMDRTTEYKYGDIDKVLHKASAILDQYD